MYAGSPLDQAEMLSTLYQSPEGTESSLGVQGRAVLPNQEQLSVVVCINCLPCMCGMWQ